MLERVIVFSPIWITCLVIYVARRFFAVKNPSETTIAAVVTFLASCWIAHLVFVALYGS